MYHNGTVFNGTVFNGTVFNGTVLDVRGRAPAPFGAIRLLTRTRGEHAGPERSDRETGVTNDNPVPAIRAFRFPTARGQDRGL